MLIFISTFLGSMYYEITLERLTYSTAEVLWDSFKMYSVSGDLADMIFLYGRQILKAFFNSVLLAFAISFPSQKFKLPQWRFLKLTPFIPYALIMGLIYYSAGGLELETKALPNQFYNLSLTTIFAAYSSNSPVKREVESPLTGKFLARHVVLIVDESIRGDFIDLNKDRGLTPFLTSQDSLIANFGLAVSASNCTNASNAILRLGANPETLGKQKILENPSIWKYAKKAGFETTYMLSYFKPQDYLNYMNEDERKLIDHYAFVDSDVIPQLYDHELAQQIIEITKRPEPQFIYLNKRGVHFPYASAYPEEEAVFKPFMKTDDPISTRERLVNTYKNAVRWTVDGFFKKLIPGINLEETLLIYTSDHGQNLMDDGKLVTHCRRISPTLNEAIVPLFVITENSALYQKFQDAAHYNLNRTNHFQVFPTILTLFGYDENHVSETYYQTLFEPVKERLGFTTGIITGLFGREPDWNPCDDIEYILQ